ncbi:hypothetical protein ABK040_014988 [Willaertia magna]
MNFHDKKKEMFAEHDINSEHNVSPYVEHRTRSFYRAQAEKNLQISFNHVVDNFQQINRKRAKLKRDPNFDRLLQEFDVVQTKREAIQEYNAVDGEYLDNLVKRKLEEEEKSKRKSKRIQYSLDFKDTVLDEYTKDLNIETIKAICTCRRITRRTPNTISRKPTASPNLEPLKRKVSTTIGMMEKSIERFNSLNSPRKISTKLRPNTAPQALLNNNTTTTRRNRTMSFKL